MGEGAGCHLQGWQPTQNQNKQSCLLTTTSGGGLGVPPSPRGEHYDLTQYNIFRGGGIPMITNAIERIYGNHTVRKGVMIRPYDGQTTRTGPHEDARYGYVAKQQTSTYIAHNLS